MDLNSLYTFKEVVKWGSYTRTGEELGYAQSSVTTQIKKLEEHYGVKLFERVGRTMRLTQSGEQLYFYVDQILALLEEAEDRFTQDINLRGTVRVGIVESLAAYFITPFIKDIKEKHPELRILLESGLCPNLRDGVMDGAYDVAVLLDRVQEQPDLVTIPVRKEDMVMIASPRHRLSGLAKMPLSEIEEETVIYTEEGCSYRVLLEQALKNGNVQPKSMLSFSSLEAIKQCVADELGIALLPRIAVEDELTNGKLVELPFEQGEMEVFTQIVYQKKKWISPSLQQLISSIENG